MPRSSRVAAALDVIIAELRGSALSSDGTSEPLNSAPARDVELEITVRVKNRVERSDVARYRAQAMVLFAEHAWNDHCPESVRNRNPWTGSKTKSCSGKVTTVVVMRGYVDETGPVQEGKYRRQVLGERYRFVCNHHADVTGPDVLAVIRLDQVALKHLRTKRANESAERAARARAAERALEAEVTAMSDSQLQERLAAARKADEWGSEDICNREIRRRAKAVA